MRYAGEEGRFEGIAVAETTLHSRLRENARRGDADAGVPARVAERDGRGVMDEVDGREVAATEGVPR